MSFTARGLAWAILLLTWNFALAPCALGAGTHESDELDWSSWRGLPVHDSGRVMPLDTYARRLVKELCGSENPKLRPAEKTATDGRGREDASGLFPGGEPRRFTAAELVFSWMVEPQRWRTVPFLAARYEPLRRDVLGLPLEDSKGNRLKFISPDDYEHSTRARKRIRELADLQRQAMADERRFEPREADKRLLELQGAFNTYSVIPLDHESRAFSFAEFDRRLMELVVTWGKIRKMDVGSWGGETDRGDAGTLLKSVNESLQLSLLARQETPFDVAKIDKLISLLCDATIVFEQFCDMRRDAVFAEAEVEQSPRLESRCEKWNVLAARSAKLARQAYMLRESLYDHEHALRVVPAPNRFAVRPEGEAAERGQPWITLRALLLGSEQLLQSYSPEQVARARGAFETARLAYLDREAPDRADRFNAAMKELASALGALGVGVEPARVELLGEDADETVLASTAYPSAEAMGRELFYNRLDPFFWSWLLTAVAFGFLLLAIGPVRKPFFFLGAIVLAAGQGFTITGLWLRGSITGMVPVANMYETVLFVGVTVALMGLCFALLPLIWPVIGASWRVTAIAPTPQVATATGLGSDDARWLWRTMPLFRLILTGALLYALSIRHLNPAGDGPIFPLLPVFSSGTVSGIAGALVVWLVGLVVLLWLLWFLPRAILAVTLGIGLIPKAIWILCAKGLGDPIRRCVARRPFLLAGAGVALLAYLLAHYVPGAIFDRDVGLSKMTALLRSNLWLTVHVIIITASYGAGALAWGLGNLSLGYYALGRYRDPKRPSEATLQAGHRPAGGYQAPESAFTRRPPEICAKLSTYIYKSVQIAVLLLAAGTITGAIWADYAWGRYWGWDPKEVWALISLLVYLAVLHGRWAGWTGNFGMAVGAVFGATSILMAWYGVNFVISSGLHSYGQSTGGEFYVLAAVVVNWLFVALAAVRHEIERRTIVKPDHSSSS